MAYLRILKREFHAQDDSFLLKVRVHLNWDKEAFLRLITAMQACCEANETQQSLPRWQAEGFWYFSWFIRDWTTHPNFPRPEPPQYHAAALTRLDDLAYWYFFGDSPYEAGTGFEPL